MTNSEQFIKDVKSNERMVLEKFYNAQKQSFMSWARSRFDSDDDTIIDVYQDAMVVLYNNIIQDKLTDFNITPEAYLFGIAKNLMLKRKLKERRTVLSDDISKEAGEGLDMALYDRIENSHRKEMLRNALSKLKESCREILTMFYYKRFSMEAIMHRLNYGSVDTVKSRKNQCMNNLKKIMQTGNT